MKLVFDIYESSVSIADFSGCTTMKMTNLATGKAVLK